MFSPEEFIRPPECPVYHPLGDDWLDPLGFIAKIRPEAEKHGICKIIPPPEWQPPFAIDVDRFKFSPRIQRLSELEATTRVRLEFFDKISKFWELQGSPLKLPTVDKTVLDLYRLRKVVKDEGGYETVTLRKLWPNVSRLMGFMSTPSKGMAGMLKQHYDRILYPYDIFAAGLRLNKEGGQTKTGKDAKSNAQRPESVTSRRSKRVAKEAIVEEKISVDYEANKELKRLQFYGPGPKAAVTCVIGETFAGDKDQAGGATKGRETKLISYAEKYVCLTCGRGEEEDKLLICESCDNTYHMFCLVPPLPALPSGDWRCPQCVRQECDKPREPYGFNYTTRQYSLQTFGEMADTFKAEHFNMPVHMVPCDVVEREFWRLTREVAEDVSVEYGADVSTRESGSGFPTAATRQLFPDDDEQYVSAPWNLNNLSVLSASVLRYINADISGMKSHAVIKLLGEDLMFLIVLMFSPEEFIRPPECPVYHPLGDDWLDPLGFIAKIRPEAEKHGICKIIPPPEWQPPFAIDVDRFKFSPRIQRLSELEATTRVRLEFFDKISKFWELQGSPLKLPTVDKTVLDLYRLRKVVKDEGGYETVTLRKLWPNVSRLMGFMSTPSKGMAGMLKQHYDRILYPYDIFAAGLRLNKEGGQTKTGKDAKSNAQRPESVTSRRSKRVAKEAIVEEKISVDYEANKELKRLQFYGPGPKAAVTCVIGETFAGDKDQAGGATKGRETKLISYAEKYVCLTCGRGEEEDKLLICESCDNTYHMFCLVPPLPALPSGDWRCPQCVRQECDKPREPYGFNYTTRQYSLQTFGEMADTFKAEHFNMPVHMVPCDVVEREFWRLTREVAEDVSVEYGADVSTRESGSGFPTAATRQLFPDDDEQYVSAPWNLNNLSVLSASVLRYINADISGMKVPWLYVGMCFSAFCWHIEDHWSYSINYLHWGEPKTWYGVPSRDADQFEAVMKAQAPELFEAQPDLLHQLVTTLHPNLLMTKGVSVVRTDQQAGEFVITFPRAYHAGLNQGYNCAEAVNFTPADWIPMGRKCIENYRLHQRHCVFSHEELVCKMAADPDVLDLSIAAATHTDMLLMVEQEKKLRKALLEKGTTTAEREAFELLQDDERQCSYCKTTCFLSAVTCPCKPEDLVCLYHVDKLCYCSPTKYCLRYRYTLDELPAMMHRLRLRAESFDRWAVQVKNALEAPEGEKLGLVEMRELVKEAEEKHFPDGELLQALKSAIAESEKCGSVAQQIVSRKVRTRSKQAAAVSESGGGGSSSSSKQDAKLTLHELELFSEQISNLPCEIRGASLIKDLLERIYAFQSDSQMALQADPPSSENLKKLLDVGQNLDIDLPELPALVQHMHRAHWLDEVNVTMADRGGGGGGGGGVGMDALRHLLEAGVTLAPHPAVERTMAHLQELLTLSERWEEKARICLQARPRHVMATLEAIIHESRGISVYLPNISALRDALKKAKDWTAKVEAIQKLSLDTESWLLSQHFPTLQGQKISENIQSLLLVMANKREAEKKVKVGDKRKLVKERRKPRKVGGGEREGDTAMKLGSKEDDDNVCAAETCFKPTGAYCDFECEHVDWVQCDGGCDDWFHYLCVGISDADMDDSSDYICYRCSHKGGAAVKVEPPEGADPEDTIVSVVSTPVDRSPQEALAAGAIMEEGLAEEAPHAAMPVAGEVVIESSSSASDPLPPPPQPPQPPQQHQQYVVPSPLPAASDTHADADSLQQHLLAKTALLVATSGGGSEHAYSTASKAAAGPSPRKHARKSPLVPRQLEAPTLELSPGGRAQLEGLMMEGDLLEVSLDETQHIWRILQACKPKDEVKFMEFDT
ncbi:PREDICTED: lysine-specific demethylase 5C-like [Priapulus caudatus]|uniref:[histone H3]-trimethyl-L-lysine(4) demethylase n=1 Tax=Priapulus caudatus TaxID=37621 RepID=A0ABM1EU87_PRICU|nr:PREDICTED: lysine-specific demethylase 5C-like [Priapulus caudatus]